MPMNTGPTTPSQTPKAANTGVKQLPFAFPFLPKRQGKPEASARFTDEHDIYRLLAGCESSGSYLVSRMGMWHGGIHVTEAGAGQALDLDAGVRCIADGHVIAYRINWTYLVNEITVPAPYSTGFALVRHTMEFPNGTTLTFYSLYMHLQAYDDYAHDSKRQKPAYWSTQFQVTEFAKDTPTTGRSGQIASADQQGLRVRQSHPHGGVTGILPQGASVSIGKQEKGWGQITDLHGSSLYPPVAGGFVASSAAVGGWIYLGKENGGSLVKEMMPDASFDRVVFPSLTASLQGDSDLGVPIKAGDLIGHLGRYDSLNQCSAGTRMVHLEVFCDDSIDSFIKQGCEWVEEHGPHPKDWAALGLPAEPTILRIAPKTKLYHDHDKNGEGANAPLTDVIQMYSLAELDRDKNRQFTEPQADKNLGRKVSWWHVESANALGNPIGGWVREYNHASGRVTREFAQKWVDFQCLEGSHDSAHTIFATSKAWAGYASGANVPDAASLARLSPLMQQLYRALFAKGDGSHAADDLCNVAGGNHGQYPWLMQASSRLIVKHESEWANPEKWKQLIAELEKQTGPKPQYAEELKRIDKLAWWDDVKAGVPGFPGPDVFHIHPIGMVGNFAAGANCIPLEKAKVLALTITSGFEGATAMDFGAVAGNGDGQGMSFGVIQWAAGQGKLGPLLERMRSADQTTFQGCFDTSSNYHTLELAISGGSQQGLVNWALDQQARNPNWKDPFIKLGEVQVFQQIQIDEAASGYHSGAMQCVEFLRSISSDLMSRVELVTYCAFFDLAVQQGSLTKTAQHIRDRVSTDHPGTQWALVRIAVEERAKKAVHDSVADCFSRRIGILQQSTFTYSAYGHTKSRANPNFHLISKDASTYVCGI